MIRIGIIGEYDETFRSHAATNEALTLAIARIGIPMEYEWISTGSVEPRFEEITSRFNGYLVAPGSPYKDMLGALKIIQFARENFLPVLGTCGGFQHMVLEFARHVLFIRNAQPAEYDPYASDLVISPLSCSLKGQTMELMITRKMSRTYKAYHADKVMEKYYCDFGLNPQYQQEIHYSGFQVVATDSNQEARIMELENHPFFIATLFVPQDNDILEKPHPLVMGFVQAVAERVLVKWN